MIEHERIWKCFAVNVDPGPYHGCHTVRLSPPEIGGPHYEWKVIFRTEGVLGDDFPVVSASGSMPAEGGISEADCQTKAMEIIRGEMAKLRA